MPEQPQMTEAASRCARGQLVPTNSGGAQIEWHQDGWDVEVEFTSEGVIDSVYVGRAQGPAPCLAVRLDGPGEGHILCDQPKGHDGDHANRLHRWEANRG